MRCDGAEDVGGRGCAAAAGERAGAAGATTGALHEGDPPGRESEPTGAESERLHAGPRCCSRAHSEGAEA